MPLIFSFYCWLASALTLPVSDGHYRCDNGKVFFHSKASLESIEAGSNKLRGAIDPANRTFAWSVETASFKGFNSPLQLEHFNENYLESTKYPRISFTGKIIESTDFHTNGKYSIRAKGKLKIHGVEQERIIRSDMEVSGNKLKVKAEFTVLLADHDIHIPQIVHQKIAEEITVTVDAVLQQ